MTLSMVCPTRGERYCPTFDEKRWKLFRNNCAVCSSGLNMAETLTDCVSNCAWGILFVELEKGFCV